MLKFTARLISPKRARPWRCRPSSTMCKSRRYGTCAASRECRFFGLNPGLKICPFRRDFCGWITGCLKSRWLRQFDCALLNVARFNARELRAGSFGGGLSCVIRQCCGYSAFNRVGWYARVFCRRGGTAADDCDQKDRCQSDQTTHNPSWFSSTRIRRSQWWRSRSARAIAYSYLRLLSA
jgi:hypothetical protein